MLAAILLLSLYDIVNAIIFLKIFIGLKSFASLDDSIHRAGVCLEKQDKSCKLAGQYCTGKLIASISLVQRWGGETNEGYHFFAVIN